MISKHTKKNVTLLSIGCGPGIIEEQLHRFRKDIYIITLDKNNIMLKNIPFHLHPILADASRLPFETYTFEIVICITSLEFMRHPENVIRKIYNILKPKGILFVLMLNPESDYVQQKIEKEDSYIGKNLNRDGFLTIKPAINDIFAETKTGFSLENKKGIIHKKSTAKEGFLLMIKAIK